MTTQPSAERSLKALEMMKQGNLRFQKGLRSVEHFPTPSKLKILSEQGQKPFCIVVSCADSRVPAEHLFDQGLGDLFVLRVAGNVIAPSLLASLEFAATQFETPLVLVMGHSKCGAIQATINNVKNPAPLPSKNLTDLVDRIKPAVTKHVEKYANDPMLVDICGIENVHNTVKRIQEDSPIVQKLIAEKKLMIASAFFCLDTGVVDVEPVPESKVTKRT
jgi:carbonic anhydrase